ncbi:glucokinase [Paracoccus sp. Z118]|uniref:glucokinase n=1 Tax=Paracoccus sp. Z118 TaxID=2851017 RepID=UPI001C2C5D02|nr:glucokinase [Paracoccus sp. Z118]
MTDLVADIGGTNLRIGRAENARISGVQVHRGPVPQADLVPLLRETGHPERVVLSVAGPVFDGIGRLTNRDWTLSEKQLSAELGCPVHVVNDMAATGFALPLLGEDGIAPIRDGGGWQGSGQSLVVNAGTGFNICPVRRIDGRTVVIDSETGHAALPAPVAAALGERIGDAAAFPTIEHLLSGPGLARLAALMDDSVVFAAELLGMTCADLALRHLPDAGLFLTGSPARAMAGQPEALRRGIDRVLSGSLPPHLARQLGRLRVLQITDDLAPLRGCAAMLAEIWGESRPSSGF